MNVERKVEIALAARDKVAQGWCQGTLARDTNGDTIAPNAPSAVAWCQTGSAIVAATGERKESLTVLMDLRRLTKQKLVKWNDTSGRTQAECIDLWDELARAYKAGEIT